MDLEVEIFGYTHRNIEIPYQIMQAELGLYCLYVWYGCFLVLQVQLLDYSVPSPYTVQ